MATEQATSRAVEPIDGVAQFRHVLRDVANEYDNNPALWVVGLFVDPEIEIPAKAVAAALDAGCLCWQQPPREAMSAIAGREWAAAGRHIVNYACDRGDDLRRNSLAADFVVNAVGKRGAKVINWATKQVIEAVRSTV